MSLPRAPGAAPPPPSRRSAKLDRSGLRPSHRAGRKLAALSSPPTTAVGREVGKQGVCQVSTFKVNFFCFFFFFAVDLRSVVRCVERFGQANQQTGV